MSASAPFSMVGSYFQKYPKNWKYKEPEDGFVRKVAGTDNYVVCLPDTETERLYKVVADCGNNKLLAEHILKFIKK
jgi:hypothetical protein